jgi:hypothetical protein
MIQNVTPFIDVKNLCSRKLWEILVFNNNEPLSAQQKHNIETELEQRQHYLTELTHRRRNTCEL